MEGLMQDYELSLQHVLWRLQRLHGKSEVVTKREQGVHRMTNADLVPRINRLAGALKRLGVKPGDRVATLAFNNYRHLELYYAVPCMGAVLHTCAFSPSTWNSSSTTRRTRSSSWISRSSAC